jgi:hypothetical protein
MDPRSDEGDPNIFFHQFSLISSNSNPLLLRQIGWPVGVWKPTTSPLFEWR